MLVTNNSSRKAGQGDTDNIVMEEWACRKCTLLNPWTAKSCEACGAQREDEDMRVHSGEIAVAIAEPISLSSPDVKADVRELRRLANERELRRLANERNRQPDRRDLHHVQAIQLGNDPVDPSTPYADAETIRGDLEGGGGGAQTATVVNDFSLYKPEDYKNPARFLCKTCLYILCFPLILVFYIAPKLIKWTAKKLGKGCVTTAKISVKVVSGTTRFVNNSIVAPVARGVGWGAGH